MKKGNYIDEKGYYRDRYGKLVHREIACSAIYLKNKKKYIKPFGDYDVHHINGNKSDNNFENLYICTHENHNKIHQEQIKRKQKFRTSEEIDNFLNKGQKKLFQENDKKRGSDDYARNFAKLNILKKEPTKKNIKLITYKPQKKIKPIIFAIIAILLFAIILAILLNNNNNENNNENNNAATYPVNSQEQPEIIVEGSKTDVIIKNNLQEAVSIEVTYRIYSNWFGIDKQNTEIFNVPANTQKSFVVYSNDGCLTAPCSVSILSFTRK